MKKNFDTGRIRLQYSDSFANMKDETFHFVREPVSGTSLIALAERNCESLRRELVFAARLLNERLLRSAEVRGSSMVTICEANPLCDLNPWALDSFTDLVLLAQFRRELRSRNSISVEYQGSNRKFSESLGRLCQYEGVHFEEVLAPSSPRRSRLGLIRRLGRVPSLYLIREFFVRQTFSPRVRRQEGVGEYVALVAPFAHLQKSEKGEEGFRSGYWGALPEKLFDLGYEVLFVHHLSSVLSWRQRWQSVRVISRGSRNSPHIHHVLSHPPLTLRRTVGSWRLWRNMRRPLTQLLEDLDGFVQGEELEWLWFSLRSSVEDNLSGQRSLIDLVLRQSMASDEATFSSVKHWIFASENQSWERCFISARRQEGHLQFSAFAHTPIRRWDLRYFALAQEIATTSTGDSHRIFDRLLVGSDSEYQALKPYLDVSGQISAVEALRFDSISPGWLYKTTSPAAEHLVVLGDYDREESETTVRVADKVRALFPFTGNAVYRPHPLHVTRDRDLAKHVSCGVSNIPSAQVGHPLVISSSRTSAFYSFLGSKIPVVIALGDRALNFCPVTDFPGLYFVSDSNSEGGSDLTALDWPDGASGDLRDILFLDEGLPRWVQTLGSDH